MRTKEFEVPAEIIVEFSEKLSEFEFANEITGTTEENEILIEVSYEKEERENVFALSEMIEDYFDDESEEG